MPETIEMFAGYPAPHVFDRPGGQRVQQLLWGDWVAATDETSAGYRRVTNARGTSGWMRDEDLSPDRLLEVNFVDVGQGDGCFIVTPDDRFLVVDAGKDDNMFWYLRWRFNLRNNPDRVIHVEHAVITHSDLDHYAGFDSLFESPSLAIGTLHHNGIVERTGDDRFGEEVESDGRTYLVDLIRSREALEALLRVESNVGRMPYPKLLLKAIDSGRIDDIRMLGSEDEFLPGYSDGDLTIQVLGPVPEKINGTPALRRLGSDGVTKNGHSVLLRLRYGDVSIALGGDLNTESQLYLLEHYTGVDFEQLERTGDRAARADAIESARETFRVEVAKSCHHGSGDISDSFLEATDAIATVISSGDNESYAHPRPDALGVTGKYGRGERPLIFSTELSRSSSVLERPERLRRTAAPMLDDERDAVNSEGLTIEESPGRIVAQFQRAIAVYGLICMRTDGTRILLAQKLEKRSGSREFDYHCIETNGGVLAYNPDR